MTKVVRYTEAEISEPADFENIGFYARQGDEFITGGAIGYPAHWAEFAIAEDTAIQLTISTGRLFKADKIYSADAPIVLNVQVHLPLVSNDQRWIALLVRGQTEVVTANRLVEADADTEETVLQAVPKTDRRFIEIVVQQGQASPTPLKPSIAGSDCCLAFVRLTSVGIAEIVMGEAWRLKNLFEVEGRLTQVEGEIVDIKRRTTSLETDVANLANKLKSIPRPEIIRQMQRDIAQCRRLLNLPDEARAYWYDAGLITADWATTHADWLARIKEGVRFAFAAERDAQLALLNPTDPNIMMIGNLMLPAWDEAPRFEVGSPDGSKSLADSIHTTTTAVQRDISRTQVQYGPTIAVCENQAEWASVGDMRIGDSFQLNGETFIFQGEITNPTANVDMSIIHTWNPTATVADVAAWNADPQSVGHKGYAVQEVQYDSYVDTYWDYVTNEYTISGSTMGQTFLIAQPMIMTSVEVYLSSKASTGDIHLALCEVDAVGRPMFDRVIEKVTVSVGNLVAGWNKFSLRPSLVDAGKRYAFTLTSTGAHNVGTVSNNKYAQGAMFLCNNGVWSQNAADVDICFRVNAAKFRRTRTVVEFDPLTLENGMTQIRLVYASWMPEGTAMVWEIKPSGADDWTMLVPMGEDNPLIGLPALTQLRLTLISTTDLAPGLVLDNKARGMTQRHRSDMKAVSKTLDFGVTGSETMMVETVVDNYDPNHHTCVNKIYIAGVATAASSTTVTPDMTKSGRYRIFSTFLRSTGTGLSSCRVQVAMTTDNVVLIPFVQNIALYAL